MIRKYRVVLVALLVLIALVFQGCNNEEKKAAEAAFSTEVTRLTEQFTQRDAAIQEAQAVIDSGNKAYVESLIPALETAISNAKAVDIAIPEMPSKIEEIKAETEKLKSIDCTESLAALSMAKQNAEYSIERERLVTAPTEAYVIERLRAVDGVKDISAVTENNDPNGNLNKQGGYTAQVFFSSPWVDQSDVYGDSLIDKGTDAGGSVEVYRTKEEATSRETYLAAFDGGILASGSHRVIGSVLIRTSNELNASQQKELENRIVRSLIHLGIDDAIQSTNVTNVGDVWGVYKDGTLDESYTGIATNNAGQWYVKNGKADFSFSGEYPYAGLLYNVVAGKVQADSNQGYVSNNQTASGPVETVAKTAVEAALTQASVTKANNPTTAATQATAQSTTRATTTRSTTAMTTASTAATTAQNTTVGE